MTGEEEQQAVAQTIKWRPWVYGEEDVALDDAAETFHEASKLSALAVDHRVRGAQFLATDPAVRATVARAAKRHPELPDVALPAPAMPGRELGEVVRERRSERRFGEAALPLGTLSTALELGYGETGTSEHEGAILRAVPSAGALYPLELYPVALRVAGLGDPALFHFDPTRHVLERVRPIAPLDAVAELGPYPELLTRSAVVIFVTAMFWRTRFKYGLRGYRFALLEAGHVVQNIVLAATARDLAAVPLGGVFDRRVDDFLEVDGVNESFVYAVSVGRRA